MSEIKKCPFCGSEAEIYNGTWENPNPGYSGRDYFCVECKSCKSRGVTIPFDYMNSFSKYTVEDFRRNHFLRAKEDDLYELYKIEKQQEAMSKWNERVAE